MFEEQVKIHKQLHGK